MPKLILILAGLLLLAQSVAGQAEDKPTIAILRLDFFDDAYVSLEAPIFSLLEAYGFISADEHAILQAQDELAGEQINVILLEAPVDFPSMNLMVERALDRGADVLIPFSTSLTQVAANIASTLENPPLILFTNVFDPYRIGVAAAPCIKPEYIAGIQAVAPYEEILPLLLVQDPDLRIIGTVYDSNSADGAYGAERIAEVGESLGLTVEQAAVTGIADLRAAAQGLVNKGVEAFALPVDMTVSSGLSIVVAVANEHGLPIFHASADDAAIGATIGAGFSYSYIDQGRGVGRLLVGYLNGDIDIATTAIHETSNISVAVNLDSADEQDLVIADELKAQSIFTIEDGDVSVPLSELWDRNQYFGFTIVQIAELVLAIAGDDYEALAAENPQASPLGIQKRLPSIQLLWSYAARAWSSQDSKAGDRAFLDSLHCADEMIAQQQAALDAAE